MKKEKILLLLLPFWEPQIPPLGISCLKSYIQEHGCPVKTVDANVVEEFNDIHNRYFDTLRSYIPGNKRGNFNNVGHDVFRNHMMASIHHEPGEEEKYLELVQIIIYKTFFTDITREQTRELDEIVKDFYHSLGNYFLKLLSGEKPSVLGLSVFRGNLAASMFAFKLTKEKYPAIKTVMGGAIFAGELALGSDNLACSADCTWLWRQGGGYRARLGIESGSPHVLELMRKKISIDQIKTTISNLARAGIKTTTYWVVGHPGETEKDFKQTLEIIEALRDDIYEAWCCPFNYYKTGQVNSSQWQEKSQLLYPPGAKEMLVVRTWTPEVEPGREEAYQRMNRFVDWCRQLGIPNPYSIFWQDFTC